MADFVLHPRLAADSIFMRDLALCQLRLNNVKSVPWLVLVPRRADISEIHQLGAADRALLIEEIAQASRAFVELYAPDKINVGAIGNVVPQLHIHVIARFKSDPLWPDPVWGRVAAEAYAAEAIATIRQKLNAIDFGANPQT
ncbi:MAG TPA: HIT family protein [Alphaproteobacteria bacterium]|nr:HIT family protein [Alphaproteobacteria bacterium]